jgi:superfamily II DNA or RNA helicase
MHRLENSLESLDLKASYITIQEDVIKDFYGPCLTSSIKYSRAVGYFRSSIFLITGESVVIFAKKGGKIRLICSPALTLEDVDAIKKNTNYLENSALVSVDQDLDNLLAYSKENYSVNVLATLLKTGVLEIKIALRTDPNSIYHDKLGIFEDVNKAKVLFKGSVNETLSAFHIKGNSESIDVFCSWHDQREKDRIANYENIFEQLWSNNFNGVRCIDFPMALKDKFIKIAEKDLDEINIEKLIGRKKTSNKKIDSLLDHQKIAIQEWKKNNYQGIFEHATGSGKTVTALSIIDEHTRDGSLAIVLIPSTLLLDQWVSEIKREIPDAAYIEVGAGNTKWRTALKTFAYGITKNQQRIIIATMQTAAINEFQQNLSNNSNILLVADEVHQIGSPKNSLALGISANKRLGLSATPKRYGDPFGTAKIFEYFGKVVEPIITLYDAIKFGQLVNYEYFPQIVNLTAEESQNWKKLSQQIQRQIAIDSTDKQMVISAKTKMLLIQRARISKKSDTKITIAKNVIKNNYRIGESWLIYCEDQDQLNKVVSSIKELNLPTLEYYSDMSSDSEQTLKQFQIAGGVLVSIRCLDEGIDIPSISHALILSSSQNPRQFIQRRGRVLRKHPSKVFARIYDAIVVPNSLEDEPDQLPLLKSEIIRALEFSDHSINKSAGNEIKLSISRLGVTVNELIDTGFEGEVVENEQ